MSKCVLHVGMHKTGTTAIQEALAAVDDQNFFYARIGNSPNHSIPIYALFSGDPNAMRRVRRQLARGGLSESDYLAEINRDLEESISRAGERMLIISGEDIAYLPPEGVKALAAHLKKHFDEIEVIAYVRPPGSYMTSAFQEMVRNGSLAHLDVNSLFRSYKQSFQKFDDTFGRDQVHLYKFDTRLLRNGDAVQDFKERLGIQMVERDVVRANESSSRELIALLFRYNGFCKRFGLDRVGAGKIRAVASKLEGLGNSKFRFAGEALEPVLAANREDIAWIEERLGASLREEFPETADGDVRSEADLIIPPGARAVLVTALGGIGEDAKQIDKVDELSLFHKLASGKWPQEEVSNVGRSASPTTKRAAQAAKRADRGERAKGLTPEERKARRAARAVRKEQGAKAADAPRANRIETSAEAVNAPPAIRFSMPELKLNPRPLLNIDKNLVVLWSPKSACTSVYVWFSYVSGFMDDVRAHGKYLHRHRIDEYYHSDLYKRGVQADLTTSRVVKIIRDPYSRAASIYRHALKTRILDDGLSFQSFLDHLASHSPKDLNVHLRPQVHAFESKKPADFVINISNSDLFAELNKVAGTLHLPVAGQHDLDWLQRLESRRKAGQVVGDGAALDEVPMTRGLARDGARFPSYKQLLTPLAREKIERIFAADFDAYAAYL